MHLLSIIALLAISSIGFAQTTYQPVKVNKDSRPLSATVLEAKILDSRESTNIKKGYDKEERFVVVTIGLKVVASTCEDFSDINLDLAQVGMNTISYNDLYFSVPTVWKAGCATGSYAPAKLLSFEISTLVGSRNKSDAGQPWGAPKWGLFSGAPVQYLSFQKGMAGGQYMWSLYKLDVTDLKNVKFEFQKDYFYVQGEAQ